MRSKFISKKYAGRKILLEDGGEIAGLGSLLIVLGPLYFSAKAISKVRELIGRNTPEITPPVDEYWDVLKSTIYTAIRGKLPLAREDYEAQHSN